MPNAAALDRAAADFRFRANLLAKLRCDYGRTGCEDRSTWDLVGLVLDEERKAERETRRLMGAPSGR